MRFSLQSLTICLVSSQARFALASPCKPLTTTALAATTTTTTIAESSTTAAARDTTTTAITDDSTTTTAGDTTTAAVGATTTTALSDLSTTFTLSEGSTTTALIEGSTTTTVAEEPTTTTLAEGTTTTAITAEPTTTTFEATTTTAAETTTTTEALEGTPLSAVFADNTVKDTYLGQDGGTYSTPQTGGSTSRARFQIEPSTNRVFTYQVDGSKVYLYTVIPSGPNYAFQFDTPANIDPYSSVYHYVQCTPDVNNVLSCESESGPTPIVWYWSASNSRYYGNSDPNYDYSPIVHFKLD
ncbi:hypothetical protein FCIRC_6744 [Fusarium circinatum]|uniref:Uncharacterized protein n=1 Tax=Fusarium circinatum TaxID=48490 RepID=A0A8H5TXJ2_FUSCI|nr:hypothetical protein FCIRC_6744 [Fusarium circinatum]